MKRLWSLSVLTLFVWAALIVVLLGFRHKFIYPFSRFAAQPAGVMGMSAQTIARSDGSDLVVWVAPPRLGRPVVFFFMGNAGSLAYFTPKLQEFAAQGYGLAAMTYRGGAGQPGEPSEAALAADALLLWDEASQLFADLPQDQRVIYGQSLGSGVASGLAAHRSPAALILETPFTSLCKTIEVTLYVVPACLLMWDERYETIERIAAINAPLLVLHGDQDGVVPLWMGQAVYDAHKGEKEIKVYPGGRHNDLRLYGASLDAMRFMDRVFSDPQN